MDNAMAISGEKIRALREARAWSQAHLAEAASLSLRTVQRVEAEGTASAETRLAIAAALGLAVADLDAVVAAPPQPVAAPDAAPAPRRWRVSPGPLETALLVLSTGGAVLFFLWLGAKLPVRVATHFGVAGDANAFMTRDGFVALMTLTVALLPALLLLLLGVGLRRDRLNIPNAAYWLAEPRRGATEAYLVRQLTWICVAACAFFCFVFWQVVAANTTASGKPALDMGATLAGMAVFMAVVGTLASLLVRHFRRDLA